MDLSIIEPRSLWLSFQSHELLNPGEGHKATASYASDVYALGMVRVLPLHVCVPTLTLKQTILASQATASDYERELMFHCRKY